MIALGALVEALLGGYALVNAGLPALAALAGFNLPPLGWPGPLTTAARLLLWPVVRPLGQSPADVGAAAILVAMLFYLALTIAAVALVNLLLRQPRASAG